MNEQTHFGVGPVREAGPALDAEIARRIFGEPKPIYTHGETRVLNAEFDGRPMRSTGGAWVERCSYHTGDVPTWEPRPFSADIATAWEVVEAMRSRGFRFDLDDSFEGWRAMFGREGVNDEDFWVVTQARIATVPLAICAVALDALTAPAATEPTP